MSDNGYNPMRWNCQTEGCFNVKHRPKIEVFAECFGGRINFGDLDASLVEVNSRALILEWKGVPGVIPQGQDIAYRNLSRTGLLVVITVAGDAETMRVSHYGAYIAGEFTGWRQADIALVKQVFRRWYDRARALPPVRLRRALKAERISKQERDEWVADYEAHQHEFDELLARALRPGLSP